MNRDGTGASDPRPPGARHPHPPEPGAPAREGSRQPGAVRGLVHSPDTGGGLGLRLVRGLVEEELGGQFALTHPAGLGSIATAIIPPVERVG